MNLKKSILLVGGDNSRKIDYLNRVADGVDARFSFAYAPDSGIEKSIVGNAIFQAGAIRDRIDISSRLANCDTKGVLIVFDAPMENEAIQKLEAECKRVADELYEWLLWHCLEILPKLNDYDYIVSLDDSPLYTYNFYTGERERIAEEKIIRVGDDPKIMQALILLLIGA